MVQNTCLSSCYLLLPVWFLNSVFDRLIDNFNLFSLCYIPSTGVRTCLFFLSSGFGFALSFSEGRSVFSMFFFFTDFFSLSLCHGGYS